MKNSFILPLLLAITVLACNSNDSKQEGQKKDSAKKTDAAKTKAEASSRKPPIINITDSVGLKRIVLCMRDSAATAERIGGKLAQIYGVKLAEVFKKEKLKNTGAPMAWYQGPKAPYFFEAGVPVNRKPAKLPNGVFVRETGTDSVIIAHFFGPYDMISQAYDAVRERMKDSKKKAGGPPYEIYIGDPLDKNGKPVDPYKVQTDVVFPVHQ